MEKIRAGKAPQVLRINHDDADDAVSLSGDSEVDSDEEESSPTKDEELIHKVRDENSVDDDNCKILPSGSCMLSFLPLFFKTHYSKVSDMLACVFLNF